MAQQTTADVMTRGVAYIPPSIPVTIAARTMRDNDVGDVVVTDREIVVHPETPVVDDDGQAQGFVSVGDMARTVDPDSALGDISAAPANL